MKDTDKMYLLASFIPKTRIDWFLGFLEHKFKITKDKVFLYDIKENEFEYLVTFKISREKKIDFRSNFDNVIIISKKDDCIFSINGLNKLIEYETGIDSANRSDNYRVDFSKYKNTLILTKNNELIIYNVSKIKCNNE